MLGVAATKNKTCLPLSVSGKFIQKKTLISTQIKKKQKNNKFKWRPLNPDILIENLKILIFLLKCRKNRIFSESIILFFIFRYFPKFLLKRSLMSVVKALKIVIKIKILSFDFLF